MAFADPQTVTVNTVDHSLDRIRSDGMRSLYALADESLSLTISHQESKDGRTRRMVRLDQRVVAADPLSSVNEYKSLGVYLVIDEPEYGFTDTQIDYLVQALNEYLTSGVVGDLCGNQH